MRSIVSISPFRCRMWELHDRIDAHINEETCKVEIDSFLKHGQFVPVLGRPLQGDPDYDIELIFGARRLFVAQHVNEPLLVEIRELSDVEAIVAMDIENRQRTDISPYERGMGYARWLRSGLFKSQDDIARALKISGSQVSRLLKIARLPSVVVGAFQSPTEICEGWGLCLSDALDDPQRRQVTLQRARAISATRRRPAASDVYNELLSANLRGRKVKSSIRDELVRNAEGDPLFRIQHRRGTIAVLLPVAMSAACLDDIRTSVANALVREGASEDGDVRASTRTLPRARVNNAVLDNLTACEQVT